ncbi:hypothetical protein EDD86DRAFT_249036 [Gorgonomyces haynaldii]|nr:hypothetical protein EDD86DRAFT_249036 [Gorgonomyces haynaldii]
MAALLDCQALRKAIPTLQANFTLGLTDCCASDSGRVTCRNGRITELRLNGTSARGTIPAGLSALSGLVYLDLEDNQLTGPIPPELSQISTLLYIRLTNNKLSGPLPPEIGNMYICLHQGIVGHVIPQSWSKLTRLTAVLFQNSGVQGPMPDSWSALNIADDCSPNQGGLPVPSTSNTYCCNLDNICSNVDRPQHCGATIQCGKEAKGLGTGAIAGIAIGAIVLLIAVVGGIMMFMRKSPKKADDPVVAYAPSQGSQPSTNHNLIQPIQMQQMPPNQISLLQHMGPNQMQQMPPNSMSPVPVMNQQYMQPMQYGDPQRMSTQMSHMPQQLPPMQMPPQNMYMAQEYANNRYSQSTAPSSTQMWMQQQVAAPEPYNFIPEPGDMVPLSEIDANRTDFVAQEGQMQHETEPQFKNK